MDSSIHPLSNWGLVVSLPHHLGNFSLFISISWSHFYFWSLKMLLNSTPIDELGNWCHERLVGPCASMRQSRKVSMATLWAGTSPSSGKQPARNFSGNTYLTQNLSRSDFQWGWKGQGTKFASEATEKIRYDGKATADGEQGWFVSMLQGKPLWAPCMQTRWKGHWRHWLEINLP